MTVITRGDRGHCYQLLHCYPFTISLYLLKIHLKCHLCLKNEYMRYRDIKQVTVTSEKNSLWSSSLASLPSYGSSRAFVDAVPESQVVSSQVKIMR